MSRCSVGHPTVPISSPRPLLPFPLSHSQRLRVAAKVLDDYRSVALPAAPRRVHVRGPTSLPLLLGDVSGGAGAAAAREPLLPAGLFSAPAGGGGAASSAGGGAGIGAGVGAGAGSGAGAVDAPRASGGGIADAVATVTAALALRAAPSGVAEGSRAAFERVQAQAAVAQDQSRAVALRRAPPKAPEPRYHAPWKLMRVISGHMGWVRSIAVDPGNEWFATGAADRTIKIWDLASGTLKLTLTGHINAVRGLAVSRRQPYLFSCGEDKMVKCWDLESNKVCCMGEGVVFATLPLPYLHLLTPPSSPTGHPRLRRAPLGRVRAGPASHARHPLYWRPRFELPRVGHAHALQHPRAHGA